LRAAEGEVRRGVGELEKCVLLCEEKEEANRVLKHKYDTLAARWERRNLEAEGEREQERVREREREKERVEERARERAREEEREAERAVERERVRVYEQEREQHARTQKNVSAVEAISKRVSLLQEELSTGKRTLNNTTTPLRSITNLRCPHTQTHTNTISLGERVQTCHTGSR